MMPVEIIAAGALSGTLVALGGALKDAPYEGFKPRTFLRSPVVALGVGGFIAAFFAEQAWTFPTLLLAIVGGERCVVEFWKILRAKKPGKFEVGEWGRSK